MEHVFSRIHIIYDLPVNLQVICYSDSYHNSTVLRCFLQNSLINDLFFQVSM